ncbi:MAG: Sarcosine oxidase [Thermoleophilia bacterium]|nr:Sarcosine oxidase [Thermoleophilia bacterium]
MIVVGLGAMGSATAFQLAARGVDVVGLDRYAPPHVHGSTHGDTRVTRAACAEGAAYVPLAMRSHELWGEIERATGSDLFTACGVLMVGPGSGMGSMHGTDDWVGATIDLAGRFGIEHEVLDGAAARARYPMFAFDDAAHAYFEPGGGFVRPEAAVAAQLMLAERHGARLHLDTEVTALRSTDAGVEIDTADGTSFAAERVVLSAGAWLPSFLASPELRATFTVYRQVLHWFDVAPAWVDRVSVEQLPVYLWSFGAGATDFFYGFPALDGAEGGVKVATEQFSEATTADDVQRDVSVEEQQSMYERCIRGRMAAVDDHALRSATCLYTVTPDSGFVIDEHPELPGVLVVSPCSGHGFKHSAAIGEAIAERLVSGRSTIDLSPFELRR